MKALWLEKAGEPLAVCDVPDPALREGGAVVRVLAAPFVSYMGSVLSGDLDYFVLPTPFIPGANGIGILETVAGDVPGLEPGQMVFLDPHTRTHVTTAVSDDILIGLTAIGPESGGMQHRWRNGTFAERALWPVENLTVLDGFAPDEAVRLAPLALAAIPYGGLLKGGLRPGQTLVVSGATGVFGSVGVLVALAMGAGAVVAVGRNEEMLGRLGKLDPRVLPCALRGDVERDAREIRDCAGPADLVLDLLGNSPTAEPTLAAIHALRRYGKAVLMGGVAAPVALPYQHLMLNEISVTGCFMYPKSAPGELVRMVRAGLLRIELIHPITYRLEDHRRALSTAARPGGLTCAMFVP